MYKIDYHTRRTVNTCQGKQSLHVNNKNNNNNNNNNNNKIMRIIIIYIIFILFFFIVSEVKLHDKTLVSRNYRK